MSNYQIIRPSIQLQSYIEGFWLQESVNNQKNNRPTTVLPTTAIDLIFVLADPFIQLNDDRIEVLPLSYVSGQKTKSVKVAATGNTQMIIARFYPWGAAPFFGFPINELTDQSIDLRLLANEKSVKELEGRLQESSDTMYRIC